ncbi:hypothetical protein BJ912DRAFT_1048322 [Pholiota molesta]|nr:hypothetical protein BJ912DRAFT_1048322 [Pholiota molesta]
MERITSSHRRKTYLADLKHPDVIPLAWDLRKWHRAPAHQHIAVFLGYMYFWTRAGAAPSFKWSSEALTAGPRGLRYPMNKGQITTMTQINTSIASTITAISISLKFIVVKIGSYEKSPGNMPSTGPIKAPLRLGRRPQKALSDPWVVRLLIRQVWTNRLTRYSMTPSLQQGMINFENHGTSNQRRNDLDESLLRERNHVLQGKYNEDKARSNNIQRMRLKENWNVNYKAPNGRESAVCKRRRNRQKLTKGREKMQRRILKKSYEERSAILVHIYSACAYIHTSQTGKWR